MTKLKPYPKWVCFVCGTKDALKTTDWTNLSTYHMGKCGVCGEKKAVTQPRDFKYPIFKGFKKP